MIEHADGAVVTQRTVICKKRTERVTKTMTIVVAGVLLCFCL